MYLGSKSRDRIGCGVCFSVLGIKISGTSPSDFGFLGVLKLEFRVGVGSGSAFRGRVQGSNFRGQPPQVSGPRIHHYFPRQNYSIEIENSSNF